NPLGSDPDPAHPKTFRVGFPTQFLSGTYTVTLGSGIVSATGDAVDANLNAGVDLLKGNPSNQTTPVTFNATIPGFGTPITSGSSVFSTLTVPDSFSIQGLTVQLNITYPNDPDLTATLRAPDG